MSVISNIHTAIVYIAKTTNGHTKSVPLFGQRGVVTIAKADKDGNYGQHLQQTMFTSIPALQADDIDFTSSKVQSHAIEYFKTIQNAIVADTLKSGGKHVTSEQIDINAICTYLETVNSPEKWDSAKIAAWFTETLAEPIGLKLLETGKTEEQMERILVATSKRFADTFASKATISRMLATELGKALSFAPDKTDGQVTKFQARIDKVLAEVNLEDSLGF